MPIVQEWVKDSSEIGGRGGLREREVKQNSAYETIIAQRKSRVKFFTSPK